MGSKPCAQVARARNVGGNRRFRIGCALQKQPEIPIDCCGEVAASEPGPPSLPQLHAVRAGLSARRGRWCRRGICDNMKTAVETVFVGKGRVYNRRFLQMRSHYLVDPVACTRRHLGGRRGQVENQVGLVRERFFTPRLRLKSYDEILRRGKLRDQRAAVSEHPLLRESGPSARPMNPDWARELQDQCLDQDVALFFKQWGGPPGGVARRKTLGRLSAL
jgi:hypothetical protein